LSVRDLTEELSGRRKREVYLCRAVALRDSGRFLVIVYYTFILEDGIEKRTPRVFKLEFHCQSSTPILEFVPVNEWLSCFLENVVKLDKISMDDVRLTGIVILNRFRNLSLFQQSKSTLTDDTFHALQRIYGETTEAGLRSNIPGDAFLKQVLQEWRSEDVPKPSLTPNFTTH
ncbi:MAG: hypothetical protein Q8P67_00005, partial [archaeon]|nr:hypothetical protein [archaeon]